MDPMGYNVQCSAHVFFSRIFGFRVVVSWQAPKGLQKHQHVKYKLKTFPLSYMRCCIYTHAQAKKTYFVWMICNCVHNVKVYCSLLWLFINHRSPNVTKIWMKGHQTIKEHTREIIANSHFPFPDFHYNFLPYYRSLNHLGFCECAHLLVPRRIRPERFCRRQATAWSGLPPRPGPAAAAKLWEPKVASI